MKKKLTQDGLVTFRLFPLSIAEVITETKLRVNNFS